MRLVAHPKDAVDARSNLLRCYKLHRWWDEVSIWPGSRVVAYEQQRTSKINADETGITLQSARRKVLPGAESLNLLPVSSCAAQHGHELRRSLLRIGNSSR